MRKQIVKIIEQINPVDNLEAEHQKNALEWIASGQEIFRIEKPATPPKHLVSYFGLFDLKNKRVLLMDHIKAELWLPSGGHVEKDEHPKTTVEREIVEELSQDAKFLNENPLFITQMVTVGKTAGHTDVNLWYALIGDSTQEIIYDKSEFNGYKWFTFDEVYQTDITQLDPHMHRFLSKCEYYFQCCK